MSKDRRHLTILIIEDNVGDFVLVEDFLHEEFENLTLSHAKSYLEAEDLLLSKNEVPFDLILLDLSLPDISGEKLIEKVMNLAGYTPVVILTGYSDLSFSKKAIARGASDFLLKDELSPSLLYKSIIYSIERSLFSAKIKQSERNYRDLFELSPEPMFLFDLDTYEFINVNKAAVKHYGYSKDEFLSMNLMEIKPDDELNSAKRIIQETREVENLKMEGEHSHVKKNGEVILVELHVSSLDYQGRNARMALARDITEKRKEEERLKLLESVITNSTELVAILEPEATEEAGRKILFVNECFTRLTGYTTDEAVGNTMHILNGPKTDETQLDRLEKSMNNWEICEAEFINYHKDGTEFWVNTSMIPVPDKAGGFSHWVVIGRDISERKGYESDLKKSLTEKEVLLSEIHHRVKNNLAVVSGMMQLQIIEEESEDVIKRLYDSVFRIQTMATIHELLYESSSFSKLFFSDIIKKLVKSIHEALHQNKDISIEYDIERIELNINQAIPSSLIVNEVITNIYKHAFSGKASGNITIDLKQNENDLVQICICDNGVGLPEDFDYNVSGHLGINIIRTLTEQLKADSELTNENGGTTFTLAFKKSGVRGMGNALL